MVSYSDAIFFNPINMQKHAHSDQAKRNKLVIALIIVILALATVTVMYLRAANEIKSLDSGEGRLKPVITAPSKSTKSTKSSVQTTTTSTPTNSVQGDMN